MSEFELARRALRLRLLRGKCDPTASRTSLRLDSAMHRSSDINWLSPSDALKLGIEVAIWPPPAIPTVLPRQSPGAAFPQRERRPKENGTTWTLSLDERAREFAASYFEHWSESNDKAIRYFASVYSEKINFFDRPISRKLLLDEKRKYAERWSERIYTVEPNSIKSKCNVTASTCTVSGRFDWECRDPGRGARSAGTADFTLQMKVTDSGAVAITGEWSTVVARRD